MESQSKDSIAVQRYLLIRIGERKFGLSLDSVREAIGMRPYTPMPCSEPYFLGLVSLRDLVIPLVDLAQRLDIPCDSQKDPKDSQQGIVICLSNTNSKYFGIAVDDIDSVVALNSNEIMPPPDLGLGTGGAYINGIAHINERLVLLINPNVIIETKDLAGKFENIA